MSWRNTDTLKNRNYICGHCGRDITSHNGYYNVNPNISHNNDIGWGYIYICHNCNKPTFFRDDEQVPGEISGKEFEEVIFHDNLIYKLYNEARKCITVGANTSAGMCCRKLLMHIAVDCGAKENLKFVEYVDYLDEKNYIPSNCKDWVSLIRTKGNEANHDIIILSNKESKTLLQFVEILIAIIYEMPYKATQFKLITDLKNLQ